MLTGKLLQIGYTPRGCVETGSGGRVEAGEALLPLVREVRVGGGEGTGLVEPGELPRSLCPPGNPVTPAGLGQPWFSYVSLSA